MKRTGFTLLELTIAMALLAIVAVLGFVATASSSESANVAKAVADVQSEARDLMTAITQELQLAGKNSDASTVPPLQAVAVVDNPAPQSPVEIVFQVPVDTTGRNWSTPIRLRFINEDANNNAVLDPGEDLDGDGLLTRRLVRLQDLDGDGQFASPGEQLPLGASNDISNVQFVVNNDVVNVTVTASKRIGMRRTNPATATLTQRVFLLN